MMGLLAILPAMSYGITTAAFQTGQLSGLRGHPTSLLSPYLRALVRYIDYAEQCNAGGAVECH